MPRYLPASCKRCGKRRADGWQISKRGYCIACGLAALAESSESMRIKHGPYYEAWHKKVAAHERRQRARGVVEPPKPRDEAGRFLPRSTID